MRKRNSKGGVVIHSTILSEWETTMFVNNELLNKTFSVIKQNKKLKEDIKQEVYDPRVGFNVFSDNPALILAEILIKSKFDKTEEFWQNVKILADYCDQRI